jgi:putative two-component system response regulator
MSKKTILLVEDDPIIRQSLKIMLENNCNYEVIEAPNGVSAIAILSSKKPNLNAAILDIMMAAGHGGSVGEYLKKNPQYDTILIIYYTALEKHQFDNKILEGALYINKQTGGLKKLEEILKEQVG